MINLVKLPDFEPEETPFGSYMQSLVDIQQKALELKKEIYYMYRLNAIIYENESNWPEDECLIPDLRPDLVKEIIEIDAMCKEPIIDAEGIINRLRNLSQDDLDCIKASEEFLDEFGLSKY